MRRHGHEPNSESRQLDISLFSRGIFSIGKFLEVLAGLENIGVETFSMSCAYDKFISCLSILSLKKVPLRFCQPGQLLCKLYRLKRWIKCRKCALDYRYHYSNVSVDVVEYDFDHILGPCLYGEIDSTKGNMWLEMHVSLPSSHVAAETCRTFGIFWGGFW